MKSAALAGTKSAYAFGPKASSVRQVRWSRFRFKATRSSRLGALVYEGTSRRLTRPITRVTVHENPLFPTNMA
ncbi:uncharacterized [Tachysurus ichikawai]